MFLRSFSNYFKENRKKIAFYAFFTLVFFIFTTDMSFAADTSSEDATKWTKVINTILSGITSIVGIFTYFVTMLLDPSFTSGKLFGLDKKLHEIWILISNIVYFIFAFILIWIAFMNIIGKGDKWELKQAMPKFIIGVLIVPFSRFFVSLVVSLSNILTFAALALPSDTFTDYNTYLNKIEIPVECEINMFDKGEEGGAAAAGGATASKSSDGWMTCDKKGTMALSATVKSTPFGLISAYTFGLMKIDSTDTNSKGAIINGLKTVADVILYLVFNSLFILVYAILLLTLGIVLLVRGIYLWLYMAMSPLFGLAYFFGKDSTGDLLKKFSVGEFIALAMVPVYTMLALSFGYLFLSITMIGISEDGTITNGEELKKGIKTEKYIIDKDSITIKNIGGESNGDFKLIVKGAAFGQKLKAGEKAGSFVGDIGDLGIGIVGALFMNIFGIVIFRIAIMTAMRSSEITKQITEPIYGFGKSIGDLAMKAPTYAPVFGGQSMESLKSASSSVSGQIASNQSTKGSKFAQSKFGSLYGGAKSAEYEQAGIKLTNTNPMPELHNEIKKTFGIGKTEELANNSKALNGLASAFEKRYNDPTYGFKTGKDEFKNLMNKLRKSVGNPDEVRKILLQLDKEGKSKEFSILGGTRTPGNIKEVDNYMGVKTQSTQGNQGSQSRNNQLVNIDLNSIKGTSGEIDINKTAEKIIKSTEQKKSELVNITSGDYIKLLRNKMTSINNDITGEQAGKIAKKVAENFSDKFKKTT